jgi:hypothetical protein
MAKNLRDLFAGAPERELSLRDLANEQVTERTVYEPELPDFTARMPGDNPNHPLVVAQLSNPFYGKSPLAVSRELREGRIPPQQERQARAWIDQYQKLSGETVYNGRNHEFEEPELTGESCLRGRADPWPFDGS